MTAVFFSAVNTETILVNGLIRQGWADGSCFEFAPKEETVAEYYTGRGSSVKVQKDIPIGGTITCRVIANSELYDLFSSSYSSRPSPLLTLSMTKRSVISSLVPTKQTTHTFFNGTVQTIGTIIYDAKATAETAVYQFKIEVSHFITS